jgi:hypothetical protein
MNPSYDDDLGPVDQPVQPQLGEAEVLLRDVIDLIATAPNVPLSSTPRIDREQVLALLDEAVARFPDEIRQARWMLKEREDFINKTRREADEIIGAARVRAERMVQRTDVVRAAEAHAQHVREAAEDLARRLKLETEDFLDQRLASFEILLDRLGKTVAAGRQRLSIGEQALNDDKDPSGEIDRSGFFDQDDS